MREGIADAGNIPRENTAEAAAVIGLAWVCWAVRGWCGAEDETDEGRAKNSKCALRRSNSRLSGAESSYFGVGLKGFAFRSVGSPSIAHVTGEHRPVIWLGYDAKAETSSLE